MLNFWVFEEEGMRSSRHGLYKLGYACVTTVMPKSGAGVNRSKSQKSNLSSNCRLQFAYMKSESLVIVNQHVTVNVLGPCTHRPSRQGSDIGSKCTKPN